MKRLLLMLLFLMSMAIIILIEKIKFKSSYKKVIDVIYDEYISIPKEEQNYSWDEFLLNYCNEHNK